MTEITKIKQQIHQLVFRAIYRGIIKIRSTCEECNKKNPEAHHDDYSEPFKIRWLCKKDHCIWHRDNKAKILTISKMKKLIKKKRKELDKLPIVGKKRHHLIVNSVSFFPEQHSFISQIAKDKQVSFSQAAREVTQFGIDAINKLRRRT